MAASGKHERVFLSPPHMGGMEQDFVNEAFNSNYIAPLGPMVDAFEREFAEYSGFRRCLALSSGTAALHLATRLLEAGIGDEVLVSTLTFIGSVTPVIFQGARPVFIDCDRETWNMDPALLEGELERLAQAGRLPKAVVVTDLYGQCADYERIGRACRARSVPLVVDAAEALGARHGDDHAGVGADFAAFSFNGNKIITTSGGGMLASDDEERIERARFLSQQAKEPSPHYEHETFGFNYRMSNIAAAIGRGQLRCLDERVHAKRSVAQYYRQALSDVAGLEFMPEAAYGRSNRWLTVVLITPEKFGADRETVRMELETENIESRPVWKPMHLQPIFDCREADDDGRDVDDLRQALLGRKVRARAVGGQASEDIFARGLCLPSGTAMRREDMERVTETIKRLAKRA